MTVFEDLNNITNEWKIEGYLSDVDKPGEFIGNHKIVGSTYEIQDLYFFNIPAPNNGGDRTETFFRKQFRT